jgi:PAS domain S-box-containing protein
MEGQLQDPAEEITRLRRSISDLVSIFSLPALWVGGEASQVANTLLDALQGMLHLDFVSIRLRAFNDERPLEMVRCAPSLNLRERPNEIGEILIDSLGADAKNWPPFVTRRFGDSDLTIVPLLIGLQGDIGVLLAGSERAGFPEQTERLILSVAANQAAIGLREACLLEEQKRLATDLDRRVGERAKELAESNKELELQVKLLQHLPVAAWTFKSDGILDFVNQGWLEYTGQTLAFVRSKPEAWMDAMHPDDRDGAVNTFWDGIRAGHGFTMETRFRRAHDGEYRWHLNRAVALHNAEGDIVRFVGTSTDISDLKQVQENLRRAEEKTRLIVDTALDAVVTMDAEGIIRSWNEQAAVIFGWHQAEAIGRRISDLIIPQELRLAHDRGLRHFLASGEGPLLRRPIEMTAVRRSGEQFPVELQVMPLKLGEEWFFSGFIRDITESKLAQQRLRQSEFNLRQMTETIPEMLWSATPDGLIDYCNTRVLDYSGLSAKEVMGEGWGKLVHPDDADRAAKIWMSCLATGEPYQVEVRALHAADHAYRWCITSALPLLDEDGRILKWFGTVVDMHDWKQSQEELRKTQAELAHVTRVMTMGQLTASIAHEVNQPLSGILMNAGTCLRMLDSDPPNIDGARETARRTIRDGNRASDVIARLRDLFKKNDTAEESVDLNNATREVIALSLSDLQSNRVVVQQDLAENLPAVKGDRIQIQQVILNLLRNASDAMRDVDDRPRQLVIKTESDESKNVQLTVRDTGTGFAPKAADRLFESFYTTKAEGMGIGLSISRSIIEAHRGRLWASANDGPGSSFAFSIPYDPSGAELP